ncbi:MAG: hypothetical protein L0956_10025, partial [Candidatus Mariimomonas ferrooxydans]
MHYQINDKGYYGGFGGAYIPEMLHANIEELKTQYLRIIEQKDFQDEYKDLLSNYVGRPTPLRLHTTSTITH